MKYVCLGYLDESAWGVLPQEQRHALMKNCGAYDDELRESGHYVGGFALQSVKNATCIRNDGGRIAITDGPFAETKEQLGGLLILEASDLDEALSLMSKHPGVQMGGCFEIRPIAELAEILT